MSTQKEPDEETYYYFGNFSLSLRSFQNKKFEKIHYARNMQEIIKINPADQMHSFVKIFQGYCKDYEN